jgi:hypothetical protein
MIQLYICGGIPEILANAIVKLPLPVPYWLSKIYRRKQSSVARWQSGRLLTETRGASSLVARQAHNLKVAGLNRPR